MDDVMIISYFDFEEIEGNNAMELRTNFKRSNDKLFTFVRKRHERILRHNEIEYGPALDSYVYVMSLQQCFDCDKSLKLT